MADEMGMICGGEGRPMGWWLVGRVKEYKKKNYGPRRP